MKTQKPLVLLLTAGTALAHFSSLAGQGPQPTICNRSCWGARAPACSITYMSSLTRAIVHHTAGSSDWTTDYETGKSRVRGVQNLHMDGNGWCDTGYHFLVNAGGHIYEGRSGSMSSLARGAHDAVNANSFGFNVMGYYHPPYNQTFTSASRASLEAVIAWRMPSAWSPYGSGSYGGLTVGYMDTHRVVTGSACPGDIVIAQMGGMRDGVNSRKNGGGGGGANTTGQWYFDTGTDSWSLGNALTALGWSASGWPGIIYADQNGTDAYFFSGPASFAGPGNASINVDVYPQSGNTANHDMKVYWTTAAENFTDESKSSPAVTYTAQNAWRRINLDCNAYKFVGHEIKLLRLDVDSNNSGTRWIVNHVYTQSTPRYQFATGTDGWTLGNGLVSLGWNNSGWPGIIYADQVGNDAYFYSPNIGFLGGANDIVEVRVYIQSSSTVNHDMQLFWKTHVENFYSADKSCPVVTYTLGNDTWASITLNVGSNPKWSNAFVTQLRLDVDNIKGANNPRWIIDYAVIGHTSSAKY